ncbi:hypothetical protein F5148DRAFT_1152755 [Russula earlei]|uniref:Uncharacterized protein n=1 Tax=Russula earlei TaxID=71964 RepID=A0ACC0TVF3_9AGAM|nr:hypothetical protein F5148DRAFT_1152755 [Russula earlei]
MPTKPCDGVVGTVSKIGEFCEGISRTSQYLAMECCTHNEWTFQMQKGEECKLMQSLSGLDGPALAFQILGWAKAIKKPSLWPSLAQPISAWLGLAHSLRLGWAKHYMEHVRKQHQKAVGHFVPPGPPYLLLHRSTTTQVPTTGNT